jgi:hypothetical protein
MEPGYDVKTVVGEQAGSSNGRHLDPGVWIFGDLYRGDGIPELFRLTDQFLRSGLVPQ